jgi:hypothetical protein
MPLYTTGSSSTMKMFRFRMTCTSICTECVKSVIPLVEAGKWNEADELIIYIQICNSTLSEVVGPLPCRGGRACASL